MRCAWKGHLPEDIPMMPDELTFTNFITKESVKNINNNEIAVGLDFEVVEGVRWDLQKLDNILILGGSQVVKQQCNTHFLKGLRGLIL